jgi:hypothetical protein
VLVVAQQLQEAGAGLVLKVDAQKVPDVFLHGVGAVGGFEGAELCELAGAQRLLQLVRSRDQFLLRNNLDQEKKWLENEAPLNGNWKQPE